MVSNYEKKQPIYHICMFSAIAVAILILIFSVSLIFTFDFSEWNGIESYRNNYWYVFFYYLPV